MTAIGCLKCKKDTIKQEIKLYKDLKCEMKKDFKVLNKFIISQKIKYDEIDKKIKKLKIKIARINGVLSSGKDDNVANKLLSEIAK